ncbi:MAG TPA: hypothetical protein VKB80_08155 [Kofleriaceae bacterium]|nr:hypothetical protein [Kofleriaceae bacterium]
MPLRDDHDAAIARADALQRELDRERASDGEQQERLEQAEKELASARERLASAEAELQRARREARPGPGATPPASSSQVSSAQSASSAPVPQASSRVGLLFGGALLSVFLICGGLVSLCSSHEPGEDPGDTAREAAEAAQSPPRPTPPFVADMLVAEGMARLGSNYLVQSVSIDYVRPDGTLDPTYGRISVDSTQAPQPPPPDDPSRPTGAPTEDPTAAALAMMMTSCPEPRWTPSDGWKMGDDGPCMTIGELPVGRPTCSTVKLWALARQEDAPQGLARITARWFIDAASSQHGVQWAWMWHFELRDDRRGVDFTHDFPDAVCKQAP